MVVEGRRLWGGLLHWTSSVSHLGGQHSKLRSTRSQCGQARTGGGACRASPRDCQPMGGLRIENLFLCQHSTPLSSVNTTFKQRESEAVCVCWRLQLPRISIPSVAVGLATLFFFPTVYGGFFIYMFFCLFLYLEKESQDFSSCVFLSCFFMVHDAS